MKITREQLKDLIKGIIAEYSLANSPSNPKKIPTDFGDHEQDKVPLKVKVKQGEIPWDAKTKEIPEPRWMNQTKVKK